jgi:hypothetical protein
VLRGIREGPWYTDNEITGFFLQYKTEANQLDGLISFCYLCRQVKVYNEETFEDLS